MKFKKAQAITEYAVIAACLVVSLVVMQAYVRRGLSGRIKDMVDSNLGTQFDPYSGTYKSGASQWGDTMEVGRMEKGEYIDSGTGKKEAWWYSSTYSVGGPHGYLDFEGYDCEEDLQGCKTYQQTCEATPDAEDCKWIIEPDDTREASFSMTYQDSTVDWKELGQ